MTSKYVFERIFDTSHNDARRRAYRVGEVLKDCPVCEQQTIESDDTAYFEFRQCGTRDAVVVGFGSLDSQGRGYPVLLKPAPGSRLVLWQS